MTDYHYGYATMAESEPVELVRSPRTLLVQCCYIGNRWTATSPALTGFQVYGTTRDDVEQAARDDLADWLDPAVTLEFAERAMTTAEAADFYEDDEPLEKVLAAYEHGEKFVTYTPTPVTITYDPTAGGAAYVYLGPTEHNVARTQELSDSVMVDYDAAGNVIGVELLGVTEPHLEGRPPCPRSSSSG